MKKKELVKTTTRNSLQTYLKEVNSIPLLTQEEEAFHITELVENGSIESAKILVSSNLRLVVKIALEYKHAYNNTLDLIQEGNIGLMKAISKYDPTKGAKLSYYASWWIKSYILKFLLDNFKIVKVSTTHEQKKLFYNLIKEKSRLELLGIIPENKLIAKNLGVSEKNVIEMDKRLSFDNHDISFDAPEGNSSYLEKFNIDESESSEDKLLNNEAIEQLSVATKKFIEQLSERDKLIFSRRILKELPDSLQSIADDLGLTKERIRQLSDSLIKKLQLEMKEFI
jgi:RNA polymerase sigma-32 factor